MKEVAIRRKTITLPENMWKEIGRFRLVASLGTDTEAVRQLLRMALDQKPSRAIEERQKAGLKRIINHLCPDVSDDI